MFASKSRTATVITVATLTLMIGAASIHSPVAAAERLAYDDAEPYAYPAARETLSEFRSQLMTIPGVMLVYVSNQGDIVVRVRKITPEISQRVPPELDHIRVRLVGVEDVLRRHRHELEMVAGADHVITMGVEAFPDGQLAIVVRESQPRYEQPMKVPTDIEGIPLRVLVAQDPLPERGNDDP
jgi:hypothetical protein